MVDTALVVTILYLIGIIAIGVYHRNTARTTLSSFLVGEFSSGRFTIAWGTFAAYATAVSFFGVVGIAYASTPFGVAAALLGAISGVVVSYLFFARAYNRLEVETYGEFFQKITGSQKAAGVLSIVYIIVTWLYTFTQLATIGVIGEYLLGIPSSYAIPLIAIPFIAYVTLGGFVSIRLTDTIQGILIFIMALVIGIVILSDFGGFSATIQAGTEVNPQFVKNTIPLTIVLGNFLAFLGNNAAYPAGILHIFSAKDTRTAEEGLAFGALIWGIFFIPMLLLAGAAGLAIFGTGAFNPDFLLLNIFDHYFPRWVVGLAMAAGLAALMSSLDGTLFAQGTMFTKDVYSRLTDTELGDDQARRYSIGMIWVLGLAAIAVAINPLPLIFQIATIAAGAVASGFLPTLIFNIYWDRTTATATVAGSIGGVLIYGITFLIDVLPASSEVLLGILANILLLLILSFSSTPPSEHTLQNRRLARGAEKEP